ncbi:G-D-S-L family lipolytic protein [Sphingobacterium spiritivorum]|uniref:G-D-S-L family lipolytic protein n=1 Tax=Sphingobacterium spiritivorum TaxID=258 RepID=UPI003DA2F2CC
MKRNKLYVGLALLVLGVASCKPEIKDFTPAAGGTANFSKYIAVGNSLTSGFADGGLYREGQQVAFTNLMAQQFKQVGGGEFTTPLFSEAQANGSGYIQLESLVNGQPVMKQITENLAYRSASPKLLTKYTDPIQNLGVPGMRLDLAFVPQFSSLNMYFERLLPDDQVGKKTYFTYATEHDHTFFSFWLGNNDALGYATNGAVYNPLDPTTKLTDLATFTGAYQNFINGLTAKGSQGVVATIPDVTAVPFFTTVTRTALLAAANAAAKAANPNAPEIKDIYIATKATPRAATDKDYFVLPFSSAGLLGKPNGANIPYGLHPANPVADNFVLDEAEAAQVVTRINEFNAAIKSIATAKGLAVADVNAFLTSVKNGIRINGLAVSNKFITGNAFSLDGIHLTPIGNAIVANVFIDAINSKYGSSVSKVDVSQYRGVKLPVQ